MTHPAPGRCAQCGTELPASLLRCPACGTLTHAIALDRLAKEAKALEADGQATDAMARWNQVLALLPRDAPQTAAVLHQIESLEKHAPAKAAAARPKGLKGLWVGAGTALLFLLGKAKFLLLGLTKIGTLLSMFAFFGVYWGLYGWKFALGLVLSIYVHEMGHVAALRHYGIPASAPMFIPGLGAFIRLKAHPPTVGQDARVGLAGPFWGAGAAIACLGLYSLTGDGLYASVVHIGAIINLFNLIPVWQLDGGRGIMPLDRIERGLLATAALVGFFLTHEATLILVGLGLGVQTFSSKQGEGDPGVLLQFAGLLGILGYLSTLRGPL